MEDSSLYDCKWSNHSNHLMKAFSNLFNTSDFADVILSCEGRRIKAHKVVLSACSLYFQEVFKENPDIRQVFIVFKDISAQTMIDILQFMYLGEVQVEEDNLQNFVEAADTLKIIGLSNETDGVESEDKSNDQEFVSSPTKQVDGESKTPLNRKSLTKRPAKKESEDEGLPEFRKKDKGRRRKISTSSSESGGATDVTPKEGEPKKRRPSNQIIVPNMQSYEAFFDATANPKHECPVCAKVMPSVTSLKKHFSVHLGRTTCQYCNKTFTREDGLKKHMESAHNITIKQA